MTASRSGKCFAAVLATALLVPGVAWAAAGPIYKCLDRNLGINYTDIPCKDGERLDDLRPGNADPAAIARLERERAAWEQSGAQRLATESLARLQSRYAMIPGYGGYGGYGVAEGYGDGLEFTWPAYGYYGYGYGYGDDRRRHGDRFDGRDGRKDGGRFDRGRRERVVPTFPQKPHR